MRWMFRAPADVEPKDRRTLLFVALALLFEEYDTAMLFSALKQIAEELQMQASDLGLYTALVRLGGLPAFLVVPVADRLGRRPVFIFATVMLGVLTVATAFVQTPLQFTVLQSFARLFVVTSTATAFVIVTEELPAQHRGWGIGALAAIGSLGHGLSAILFARIEYLPYGWRALYVVGIVPILCLPLFLRFVPETQRFLAQVAQRGVHDKGLWNAATAPMRELFTLQPRRAGALGLCGVLVAGGTLPTIQFSGYYTQTKLAWEPAQYSAMMLVAGGLGIAGNVIAGRLGDRYGRRIVGAVLLATFPLTSFAFFHGDSTTVVIAWVPLVFCLMGGRVILRAFSAELFATAQRGAASGVFSVSEMIGAITGLLLVHAYGTPSIAEIGRVVPAVALLNVACALIVLTFPETKNRELEDFTVVGH
jgi:MFS family permease